MNNCERSIRALGVFTLIGFVLIAGTPLSSAVGRKLAVTESLRSSDAIVVLGAGLIHAGILREESLRRVLRGIELYKQGRAPILIVLGNSSEAEIRSRLALSMGIPASAIIKIETSSTTREEAAETSMLLRQRNAHRIILVTESLHMRRAKLIFERTGLEIWPAVSSDYATGMFSPSDRFWLSMRIIQEFTALIYYRLAGYI